MKEPLSYPVHWLIRNLLMHEFIGTSPHPIGPGTKAYSLAMKEASELADMDSLDITDEKM
jgi:hypothetical protein